MAPVVFASEVVSAINETLGAIVIGAFVNAILYGILVLQTYIFFQQSRKETLLLRFSIWTLFFFNTLHLVCIIHALYFYMVTNFSNIVVLVTIIPWSGPMIILLTTTSTVLVQAWFIFRVWKLSDGNIPLTVVLVFGGVICFGSGSALTVKLFQLSTFLGFAEADWLVFFVIGVDIAEDLVIAVSLCYYIHKMRPPLRRSSSIVNILMVYTINTGLLTSFLCGALVITRVTRPETFIFFGLSFPLSNLYSNALLGSLNARDWFRDSFQKAAEAVTIQLPVDDVRELVTPPSPIMFTSRSTERDIGGGGIQSEVDSSSKGTVVSVQSRHESQGHV